MASIFGSSSVGSLSRRSSKRFVTPSCRTCGCSFDRPAQAPRIQAGVSSRQLHTVSRSSARWQATFSSLKRVPVLPPRRTYYSYDRLTPKPTDRFSAAEQTLLKAAYAHVPEHGFTLEGLARGASCLGYLGISTSILPDGEFSLILWHLLTQREALADHAASLFLAMDGEEGGRRLGVGNKLEMLVWERLMGNKEIIHQWQQALAIMAQPSYAPESLKELARLSDEIWFQVGDTSMDTSWYTKRASLSAVYASTEMAMTTDKSADFAETRQFLKRRLQDVQEVGGSVRSIGEWLGFTASAGVNVLRSKGVRI